MTRAPKSGLPGRRAFLAGVAISGVAAGSVAARQVAEPVFDSHFHIIDPRFPLIANQGYLPPPFSLSSYLAAARPLGVTGGGGRLRLLPGVRPRLLSRHPRRTRSRLVRVTQVPADISDQSLIDLSHAGVRALRFNMYRGRIDSVDDVVAMATRAHAIAGWHAEIYADAASLRPHVDRLARMQAPLSIDHLGMTRAGLPVLLDLVAAGVKVKATGFGRVKMDVANALQAVAARDPSALMFGTDLPSTRAKRPFEAADIDLLRQVLGHDLARRALWDNARAIYA